MTYNIYKNLFNPELLRFNPLAPASWALAWLAHFASFPEDKIAGFAMSRFNAQFSWFD